MDIEKGVSPQIRLTLNGTLRTRESLRTSSLINCAFSYANLSVDFLDAIKGKKAGRVCYTEKPEN